MKYPIDRKERIILGGISQAIHIWGTKEENPVVLFLHGGLTHSFVRYYAPDIDYDNTDAVVSRINSLGFREIWDDASPVWFRPQYNKEKMYSLPVERFS